MQNNIILVTKGSEIGLWPSIDYVCVQFDTESIVGLGSDLW